MLLTIPLGARVLEQLGHSAGSTLVLQVLRDNRCTHETRNRSNVLFPLRTTKRRLERRLAWLGQRAFYDPHLDLGQEL
jgi:hypothetical protein